MTSGSSLVALSDAIESAATPDTAGSAPETEPLLLDAVWDDQEPSTVPKSNIWIPALFLLSGAAWSGAFAWAHLPALRQGLSFSTGVALIADWAPVMALIVATWLLLVRSSRRESLRFGEAARELSRESQLLETRLETVNRELSLAREFIAAQSRDLEALGRSAVERISGQADRLSGLVADSAARVDTIGSVSEAALDNMEKLRSQLPVISSSAKDVTNQIGNAGRTALVHLQDLVNGFGRLNEFGQASERQVFMLRSQVDEALVTFSGQFETLDAKVAGQLGALRESTDSLWSHIAERESSGSALIRERAAALGQEIGEAAQQLDENEAALLNSMRARLSALRDEGAAMSRSYTAAEQAALSRWEDATKRLELGLRDALGRIEEIDAKAVASARLRIEELAAEGERMDERLGERDKHFSSEVAERQREAEQRHQDLMTQLTAQIEGFDALVADHRAHYDAHVRLIAEHGETAAGQIDAMEQRMTAIAQRGGEAASRIAASHAALGAIEQAIAGLTDGTVRLLELIQASVQHSETGLPQAIAAGENRLVSIEQRAASLKSLVEQTADRGDAMAGRLTEGQNALAEIETLHGSLAQRATAHLDRIAEIGRALEAADRQAGQFGEQTIAGLSAAIERLGTAANAALADLSGSGAQSIDTIAQQFGERSREAIDQTLRARMAEVAGELETAAASASAISRESAVQMREQLARLDELTGNLERRVAQARERAEERVDNDFARRVALITESLNSNAIDIARALDVDVSDSAWASYLRGDRGVFTRRAVKLLEPAQAKAVAQIYRQDTDFRDHVSRYIHDFEAMLRQLLSTRDGHALGVTLLSSDMGKLYVALAQAIERLRN